MKNLKNEVFFVILDVSIIIIFSSYITYYFTRRAKSFYENNFDYLFKTYIFKQILVYNSKRKRIISQRINMFFNENKNLRK